MMHQETARQETRRFELTRIPWLRRLLVSRWPLFLARAVTLAGFVLTIVAGLIGSPVGSHNFAIIFVWIAWWTFLKLIALPLGGRAWCSICPIPMVGEWIQQGALVEPHGMGLGLGRQWPKRLRNVWLPTLGFGVIGLFSAVTLTQPRVTGWVLLGFILLAVVLSLVFERRAFCRHVCPIGGFIGLYSRVAPVEVRVRDRAVCASHADKTCVIGNEHGHGCPWQASPVSLTQNTNCGLCMECLRSCSYDNIAVNLRPFGADLAQRAGRSLDQAYFGFMMLGSVVIYSAVMLGAWGDLKTAAYNVGTAGWFVYAGVLLAFTLGVLPGLFLLAVWAGRALAGSKVSLKKTFIAQGHAIIPLGLMAWVAFTISFAFAKFSYVWSVLSDPFGWGWNLFGTARWPWTPYLSSITPLLQVLTLLGGLVWTSIWVRRIAQEELPEKSAARQSLPVMLFCLVFTIGMLWLLVG